MTATRWQYRLVNAGAFNSIDRMVAALADLGADGWELVVSVDKASNWFNWEKAMLIFRREVAPGEEKRGPWASVYGVDGATGTATGMGDDYDAAPY